MKKKCPKRFEIHHGFMFRNLFYLLFLLPTSLLAQFHLNGTARQISDRCFQLTDEQFSKVGSIWDSTKINLNESFDVNLDLFFGCKDANGADGIVFGFQPISTSIGAVGEGMGFLGVQPSIGIEMDTYQNTNRNDPTFDHIAIFKNGDVTHGSANTLAGPVSIDPSGNVEDCKLHNIRVTWDAVGKKLEVFIDCVSKISYTGDIVRDIFNGDPNVFWGFTAATGGAVNRQEVCFKFATLLDKPSRVNLCLGDTVQLQAYGGVTYQWMPSTGLSNATVANPIAKPDTSTTYTVIAKDKCGTEFRKDIRLEVNGDPIIFALGNDTTLCFGNVVQLDASGVHAKTFQWSTGQTDSIIYVRDNGVYTALLTRGNCSATDSIKIHFIRPPAVDLGSDTLLCEQKKWLIRVGAEKATYRWQDGSTLPSYVVIAAGNYAVTVTNPCGRDSGAVKVRYEDCYKVFIPNVFSPNGDNMNDLLTIFGDNHVRRIKSFQIFNRWGGLVYRAVDFAPNDLTVGWNGRGSNGQILGADVFVYWAEIEFLDGSVVTKMGDVSLIR
jgi:gliding motility-associated-like protein